MPKIKYFAPEVIDLKYLNPNGHLYDEALLSWVTRQYLENPATQPEKYSKYQLPKKAPFSFCIVGDEDSKHGFAIYEGNIGSGAFAAVKLGIDLGTGEWVAIKVMTDDEKDSAITSEKSEKEEESEEAFGTFVVGEEDNIRSDEILDETVDTNVEEFKVLIELKQAKGVFTHVSPSKGVKQKCYVMKLAYGKPLENIDNLTTNEALEIIIELLKSYYLMMEGKRILHRDIKPANILYDFRTKTIYIVDVGVAIKLSTLKDKIADTVQGSPNWLDPEIDLEGKLYLISKKFKKLVNLLTLKEEITNQINLFKQNFSEIDTAVIQSALNEYLQKQEIDLDDQSKKIIQVEALKKKSLSKKIRFLNAVAVEIKDDVALAQLIKITVQTESQEKIDDCIDLYLKNLRNKRDYAELQIAALRDVLTQVPITESAAEYYIPLYVEHLENEIDALVKKINKISSDITELNQTVSIEDIIASTGEPVKKVHADAQDIIPEIDDYLSNPSSDFSALRSKLESTIEQIESELKSEVDYSFQTEMYPIALVILSILNKTHNDNFVRNILNNFFAKYDWKKKDSRPSLLEAKQFFEVLLASNLENTGERNKLPMLLDCALMLDENGEPNEIKIAQIASDITLQGFSSILLYSQPALDYNNYVVIRRGLEQNNLKVWHEIIELAPRENIKQLKSKAREIIDDRKIHEINILKVQEQELNRELVTINEAIEAIDKKIKSLQDKLQDAQEVADKKLPALLISAQKFTEELAAYRGEKSEDIFADNSNLSLDEKLNILNNEFGKLVDSGLDEDRKFIESIKVRFHKLAREHDSYKKLVASTATKKILETTLSKREGLPVQKNRIEAQLVEVKAKISDQLRDRYVVDIYEPSIQAKAEFSEASSVESSKESAPLFASSGELTYADENSEVIDSALEEEKPDVLLIPSERNSTNSNAGQFDLEDNLSLELYQLGVSLNRAEIEKYYHLLNDYDLKYKEDKSSIGKARHAFVKQMSDILKPFLTDNLSASDALKQLQEVSKQYKDKHFNPLHQFSRDTTLIQYYKKLTKVLNLIVYFEQEKEGNISVKKISPNAPSVKSHSLFKNNKIMQKITTLADKIKNTKLRS